MKNNTILVRKKVVYSKSHKSKKELYEFKTILGYFDDSVSILGNFKGCVSDKDYHTTTIDSVHPQVLDNFKESEVYPSEENFRIRKEEEDEKEREKKEHEMFFNNIAEKVKEYDLTPKDGQPREVVFYNTFGLFHLSEEIISSYAVLKYGKEKIDNLDEIMDLETSHIELKNGKYIAGRDIPRHDPLLIALIKELELKKEEQSAFEICKVEGKYFISEYDGRERVHDKKNLKREYGWYDVAEEDFDNPKEVDVVATKSYFFWLKDETICTYALKKYGCSMIENLEEVKHFKTGIVELKTGEIIKDSTVIRHDPLLVEIAKELEIANGENPNEIYIERVKFPYWINNDSDYTEIITDYDELRTSLDWN